MTSLGFLLAIVRAPSMRRLVLVACLPLLVLLEIYKRLATKKSPKLSSQCIDESKFPSTLEFQRYLDKLGDAGLRSTGSQAHAEFVSWVEEEIRGIEGLILTDDEYDILRWQTKGKSLKEAGWLVVESAGHLQHIDIAGAVPFSLPTETTFTDMVYVDKDSPIDSSHAGKIILRDFPYHAIPYALTMVSSYSKTFDLNSDLLSSYDRPSQADGPLMRDLLEAGKVGAAGVIILFDVRSEQIESYFEPHQGVHYQIPGVFLGGVESALVKAIAGKGGKAKMSVFAEVGPATTRNVTASLPGRTSEKVCFVTHTDGNTQVQDDGVAALLALAKYFAAVPIESRRRTIEFNFNTAHLHISREGSHRHAEQLDRGYDDGNLALVVAVEHMGTREIEARPCQDGSPGRELYFSGRNEMMFWCTGPSQPVIKAVEAAVSRRRLDRMLMTRGTSMPDFSVVPTYATLGGIGSYYHSMCLPTTSLISGPWSLWAPHFGASAVDVKRLRDQTMALGDVYLAVDGLSGRRWRVVMQIIEGGGVRVQSLFLSGYQKRRVGDERQSGCN